MRYGIIVGGKVTEPTDIAPSGQADPVAWLTKYRFSGVWVAVSNDCVPGATYNGPGDSTNPAAPPAVPKTLTWAELATYLITLLGGGATGRAALGTIIKACLDSALGADNFFAVYFQGQTTFTKAEFTGVLAGVATSIVTANGKQAVADQWPTTTA